MSIAMQGRSQGMILILTHTVEQDISADMLFSRLGDFAVSRILIFADADCRYGAFY